MNSDDEPEVPTVGSVPADLRQDEISYSCPRLLDWAVPGAFFDISPELSAETAVFPGDTAFSRKVAVDFKTGGNLLLSSIHSTLHIGAHADAPNHYHPSGSGISERPLEPYLGECQVIDVHPGAGARIVPTDLAEKKIVARRILLKTGSFPDPKVWRENFRSLSPELVDWLADQGVTLIGIDTPSVDPAESKALEAHQAIFRRDIAILEGIVLDRVPEGSYILIALPLRIQSADASPVRAILLRREAGSHMARWLGKTP